MLGTLVIPVMRVKLVAGVAVAVARLLDVPDPDRVVKGLMQMAVQVARVMLAEVPVLIHLVVMAVPVE